MTLSSILRDFVRKKALALSASGSVKTFYSLFYYIHGMYLLLLIITDGWGGYNELSKCGYRHKRVVLSDTGDPAHVSMPGVHRVAALLKRWLMGTHQGSVSEKHLDYYLNPARQ